MDQPFLTFISRKRESLKGVSQGSILSLTLFNLKINITKCLDSGIDDTLDVDDFCITSRSKYKRTAECPLQQWIQKISQWANTNDFSISKSKIRYMHFGYTRKMHDDSTLKVDGTEIPISFMKETKLNPKI